MPLIDLETDKGDLIAVNPRHVVKLRQVHINKKEEDAQPIFVTTISLAGGTQETVKGSRREVEQKFGAYV